MRNVRWTVALVVLAWLVSVPTAAHAASPTITLSVDSGPPGTHVTITGAGFPAGEIVGLYIDAPVGYIGAPGPRADAQGNIAEAFAWPGKGWDPTKQVDPSKPGTHNVCGDTMWPGSTQTIAAKACAPYLVPVSTSSQQPNTDFSRLFLLAIVGFAILVAAAVGAVIWSRRAGN